VAGGGIGRLVNEDGTQETSSETPIKTLSLLHTDLVVTVFEANVLNHDNRRGDLSTGRKIKRECL
jgi:hypothetical protein